MFKFPFAAKTPAVTSSESPGRKNPTMSPVSANTMAVMADRPPNATIVSTSVSLWKSSLSHSMSAGDGSRRADRKGQDRISSMNEYTDEHARAGITAALPAIDTWPNQYADYEITVEFHEYTTICPQTGRPH